MAILKVFTTPTSELLARFTKDGKCRISIYETMTDSTPISISLDEDDLTELINELMLIKESIKKHNPWE